MPASQSSDKRQAAREVIDILHEISILLVRLPFFFILPIPSLIWGLQFEDADLLVSTCAPGEQANWYILEHELEPD